MFLNALTGHEPMKKKQLLRANDMAYSSKALRKSHKNIISSQVLLKLLVTDVRYKVAHTFQSMCG